MPEIPALRRLRQKDQEFQASLGYIGKKGGRGQQTEENQVIQPKASDISELMGTRTFKVTLK
jgi:hypothetical protein